MSLDHIIVAVDGENIPKVKSMTRGSTHKYRSAAAVIKHSSPRKKEQTAKTSEVLWETCVAEANGKERTYDMGGEYRVCDIVVHHVFGKGVVRNFISISTACSLKTKSG